MLGTLSFKAFNCISSCETTTKASLLKDRRSGWSGVTNRFTQFYLKIRGRNNHKWQQYSYNFLSLNVFRCQIVSRSDRTAHLFAFFTLKNSSWSFKLGILAQRHIWSMQDWGSQHNTWLGIRWSLWITQGANLKFVQRQGKSCSYWATCRMRSKRTSHYHLDSQQGCM